MTKELYCVYFESANYAGYGEHCLVMAESVEEAMENDLVTSYAEEFYKEQDEEQFIEDYGQANADEAIWASIMTVTLVAGSDFEKFVADPSQAEFYPCVN